LEKRGGLLVVWESHNSVLDLLDWGGAARTLPESVKRNATPTRKKIQANI
jgi:hypothetical protein